jgi:hypothetical protein
LYEELRSKFTFEVTKAKEFSLRHPAISASVKPTINISNLTSTFTILRDEEIRVAGGRNDDPVTSDQWVQYLLAQPAFMHVVREIKRKYRSGYVGISGTCFVSRNSSNR